MKQRLLLSLGVTVFAAATLPTMPACGGGGGGSPDAAPNIEILEPEPTGAPTATVLAADTELGCLGKPADAPTGTAVELPGYVRTLADPTAETPPPVAKVEAFTAGGDALGSGFADPTKQGRVAVSVSFTGGGFDGYVMVTEAGYLDYRFQTNRPISAATVNGYAWLVTADEVATWATTLGVTADPAKGILVGGVQDCQAFALENIVVQVNSVTDGVQYPDGPTPVVCPTGASCARPFTAVAGATYTNETGRFLLPNVAPGPVTVKAFGRLTAGGPLTLIATIQTNVAAGGITAVSLLPRMGAE